MKSRDAAGLTIALALAAALRFWGLPFGLPHSLARPDEEKIIDAALRVFRGDPNPHFFLYPSLFIYLTAAGYGLLAAFDRSVDPVVQHMVPRVLSALAGVATVGVLYGAARELATRRAALIAAVLLAVVFLHVRDSHFGVTDVPVGLAVVGAFWCAVRCATRGVSIRRLAVAGFVCGLATSTKYNAALAVLPTVIVIITDAQQTGRAAIHRSIDGLTIVFAALAAGFLLGTPFALLDRPGFLADFAQQSRTALGTQHGSILDPARQVGERGWIHHAIFTLPLGVGVPLLFAAVIGACYLIVTRPSRGVLVASFPLAYYAAMGLSVLVYARWMTPIVPFVCLTAAVAIDAASWAAERHWGPRPGFATTIVLTCAVGLPTMVRSIAFDRLIDRTDTRVVAARWLERRFPEGASLYQTGVFYGHLEPQPPDRYPEVGFHESSGRFDLDENSSERLPDLVVVLDSPLTIFSTVPKTLERVLETRYVQLAAFGASRPERAAQGIYDQQDAFYVPLANFESLKRPGPDVRIFVRRSGPAL